MIEEVAPAGHAPSVIRSVRIEVIMRGLEKTLSLFVRASETSSTPVLYYVLRKSRDKKTNKNGFLQIPSAITCISPGAKLPLLQEVTSEAAKRVRSGVPEALRPNGKTWLWSVTYLPETRSVFVVCEPPVDSELDLQCKADETEFALRPGSILWRAQSKEDGGGRVSSLLEELELVHGNITQEDIDGAGEAGILGRIIASFRASEENSKEKAAQAAARRAAAVEARAANRRKKIEEQKKKREIEQKEKAQREAQIESYKEERTISRDKYGYEIFLSDEEPGSGEDVSSEQEGDYSDDDARVLGNDKDGFGYNSNDSDVGTEDSDFLAGEDESESDVESDDDAAKLQRARRELRRLEEKRKEKKRKEEIAKRRKEKRKLAVPKSEEAIVEDFLQADGAPPDIVTMEDKSFDLLMDNLRSSGPFHEDGKTPRLSKTQTSFVACPEGAIASTGKRKRVITESASSSGSDSEPPLRRRRRQTLADSAPSSATETTQLFAKLAYARASVAYGPKQTRETALGNLADVFAGLCDQERQTFVNIRKSFDPEAEEMAQRFYDETKKMLTSCVERLSSPAAASQPPAEAPEAVAIVIDSNTEEV